MSSNYNFRDGMKKSLRKCAPDTLAQPFMYYFHGCSVMPISQTFPVS